MGIEPTRPAWKAGILPLNYTRSVYCLTDNVVYYIKNPLSCQHLFQKNGLYFASCFFFDSFASSCKMCYDEIEKGSLL